MVRLVPVLGPLVGAASQRVAISGHLQQVQSPPGQTTQRG